MRKIQKSVLWATVFAGRGGVVFFLSLLMVGCLKTRSDVEEAQEKQVFKQQLVNIQKKSSDQLLAYDSLQEEYRGLNGRVEKMEAFLQQESERQKVSEGDLQKKITTIENKLAMIEAALLEQEQKNTQALTELRTELGQSLKDLATSMSAMTSAKSGKSTGKGDKAAHSGANSSANGSAKLGGADLQSFNEAEDLFYKKEWRKAVLAYEKYRSTYPKGSSYAMATYKIGVCFSELGMATEAEAFYSEVLEKFPQSKAAKSAAYRLKNLKK